MHRRSVRGRLHLRRWLQRQRGVHQQQVQVRIRILNFSQTRQTRLIDLNSDSRVDKCKIRLSSRCSHGFIAGPEHCLDINECDDHPCHSSADCVNLRGSYRCVCPQGTAGDPVGTGCAISHQCILDADCPDSQACIQHNCTDPCSLVDCGLNTICSVFDHAAACQCQPGYIGDSSGCFKVECLSNNDCPTDKYCNQDANKCSSE